MSEDATQGRRHGVVKQVPIVTEGRGGKGNRTMVVAGDAGVWVGELEDVLLGECD